MKKIISICLLFFLFALSACDNSVEKIEYSVLNDFESREDVIFNVYTGFFGKLALNENTDFITSGSKSLKMNPVGDLVDQANIPNVRFTVPKDYKDISKYSYLRFDMFNDSNEDVEIKISYTFKNSDHILMETSETKIVVSSNKMNKVLVPIDAKSLSLIYDVYNLQTINFKFNRYIDNNSPDLYLDQLSFVHSDEEFEEEEIILNQNEIVSFDHKYQENAFISSGYGAVTGFTPILSINTNKDYSLEGNSLKMTAPKGMIKDGSWPYIELSPKIIDKIDFASLDNNDEIAFDIYNASDDTTLFSVDFHSGDFKNAYKITIVSKPHQWTTVKINIEQINSLSESDNLLSHNLGTLRICYGEFANRDSKVFYFDSFRIIKNA